MNEWIITMNGTVRCKLTGVVMSYDEAKRRLNATPDLLEALEDLYTRCNSVGDNNLPKQILPGLVTAEIAIRKARAVS